VNIVTIKGIGFVKTKKNAIALCGSLGAALLLSACAVKPEAVSEAETASRLQEFRVALTEQPRPSAPITLHEAMARALRYNLSTRVKEVERQIAENRADAAIWAMLPKVVGEGSWTARDNTQASSSKSVNTGAQSLETSTSTDQRHRDGDVKISWNVLDFGVSYFTARQMSNQALVAEERRRKVVQTLLNDVRDAYWKAVAAERLLERIEDTLGKVRTAIAKAEQIEESRAQKPAEILGYQRELYGKLLQLQGLRRTLMASKYDLAKMMNLPPTTDFKVVVPEQAQPLPGLRIDVAALEDQALRVRPELVEESLQERIAADEVRKAIARMFPGLEFVGSKDYSSNSFLLHKTWAEASVKLTWNLMNLLSGWDDIDQAEKQQRLVSVRRQTLGMAVMTQVDLAYLDYLEAEDAFKTASRIQVVNERIEEHKRQEAGSANLGELELIQMQLNTLLAQMKKDEQYAQLQNALGRLAMSAGEDPFAGVDDQGDVGEMAKRIESREHEWLSGRWFTDAKS
jgi:outer membrane protein TolC